MSRRRGPRDRRVTAEHVTQPASTSARDTIPSLLFRAALTSFDVLHARARGWKRQFLDLIVAFGELVFLWILYWGSYPFVLRQLRQVSTALPISMALVYVVVPISAVLGIFVTIERILFSLCAGEG